MSSNVSSSLERLCVKVTGNQSVQDENIETCGQLVAKFNLSAIGLRDTLPG